MRRLLLLAIVVLATADLATGQATGGGLFADARFQNDTSMVQARRLWQAAKYDELLLLLTPLAEQGHAAAQFLLGGLYSQGVSVQQDPELALQW